MRVVDRVGPVDRRDGPTEVVGGLVDRSRQERSGAWLRVGVEESDLERSAWPREVSGRVGKDTDRERSALLQLVSVRRVGEGVVDCLVGAPALNDLVSRHSGAAEDRVEPVVGGRERSLAPSLTSAARCGLCMLAVRRPEDFVRTPISRSPSAGEIARLMLSESFSRRATKSVTSVSPRALFPLMSARVALASSLFMAAVELFHVSGVKPRVSVVITPRGTALRVPRRVSAAPEE